MSDPNVIHMVRNDRPNGTMCTDEGFVAQFITLVNCSKCENLLRIERLKQAGPPSGWYHFGTHAGWTSDVPLLEFSDDKDEALEPLWERPVPQEVMDAGNWCKVCGYLEDAEDMTPTKCMSCGCHPSEHIKVEVKKVGTL